MYATNEELQTIRQVLMTYASGLEVWAFGSRVTGENIKKFSDLDIVVMTDEKLSINDHARIKDAFEVSSLPYRVDVLDWSTVSENFRKIIQQNYEVIQQRPDWWERVFGSISEIESEELLPGLHARMVHNANNTIIFWTIDAGALLPEHHHIHEQTTLLTKGDFELTVDGQMRQMKAGDIAVIAPNKLHSGKAITACEITDIFYPLRHDTIKDTIKAND